MVRRNPDGYDPIESSVLERMARRTVNLSVDDIAVVVGDALKTQRREILKHVNRLFQLAEIRSSAQKDDVRFRNLHRRLTQIESELRLLHRKGTLS